MADTDIFGRLHKDIMRRMEDEFCNPEMESREKANYTKNMLKEPVTTRFVQNPDLTGFTDVPDALPDNSIEARTRAVIGDLKSLFAAVGTDTVAAETISREVLEVVSSASRSSSPRTIELPASPPAWWRDRQPGDTPDKWLASHYGPYIGNGLTRSFFQRPGQDKAFYNGLLAWEKAGNVLPDTLRLPTKAELNTLQVEQAGGLSGARARLQAPEIREARRVYSNALNRAG